MSQTTIPGVPPAGDPPAGNHGNLPPATLPAAPAAPAAQEDTLGLHKPVQAPAPAEVEQSAFTEQDLQTGDAGLDVNIRLFTQMTGATPADIQRALGNAVKYGDPALIDTTFLNEKFKDKAPMALELAKAYMQGVSARVSSEVATVHRLAGGEQNWAAARDAFNSVAPEHVKSAARALADSGRATDAAKLVLDYARQAGVVVVPGQQLQGGGSGLVGQALTAAEFSAEFRKLREEFKGRSLESGPAKARYDDLLRRREQGRALGR